MKPVINLVDAISIHYKYSSGASTSELAREYSVSQNTVLNVLRQKGPYQGLGIPKIEIRGAGNGGAEESHGI